MNVDRMRRYVTRTRKVDPRCGDTDCWICRPDDD